MQYDEVVSSVQTRSGRSRDETETLVHATLRVLAQRLTAGARRTQPVPPAGSRAEPVAGAVAARGPSAW